MQDRAKWLRPGEARLLLPIRTLDPVLHSAITAHGTSHLYLVTIARARTRHAKSCAAFRPILLDSPARHWARAQDDDALLSRFIRRQVKGEAS